MFFGRLADHGAGECKRHYVALEKLQKARDEWNRDQMKRLDLINKTLRKRNEARAYINNVDEEMLECYCVFAKKLNVYHLTLNYQIYFIHQRHKKMANYYLL